MNIFPIFRLTIFLAAGIFFAETIQLNAGTWIWVLSVLILVVSGFTIRHCSYRGRWLFGVEMAFCVFLVGTALTGRARQKVYAEWPATNQAFVGVIQDIPVEKPKTIQFRVRTDLGKDVLLYLFKDSLSTSLQLGEEILFLTRMKSPGYFYYQGISGTAYVAARYWKRTGRVHPLSWKQQALMFREKMLGRYRDWGIGESQLPVLSALTLGYKGELDQEVRTAYSNAGIAHVLALSGMHIGILWLLFDFLLKPMDMLRRLRWMKWLVVTLLLWAFTFVAGLGASVVRAVMMCMLMGLGQLAGVKSLSMNTLSIAAFFMLLYRPFYLFDVGFQLSFIAVVSILYLYNPIYNLFPLKHRLLKGIWGILSVSVAAQMGTAPLVMYCFSSFSVYFWLGNLAVAVLLPLILYGTVLMLVLAPFPFVRQWVVDGLNLLIGMMDKVAHWTSSLPYSTLTISDLRAIEVAVFYGCLLAGLAYWKSRRRKWLIGCMALTALQLGLHLFLIHFVE